MPFLAPGHRPLLRVWLGRAHVAPWWGDPEKALAHASEHASAMHAIIAVDGEPVGYVCWQSLSVEELSATGLGGLPTDHIDIDILIGEDVCLGRGIGPRVLLMVIERLWSSGISSVGVATEVGNQRARRAFEKAGFRPLGVFEDEGRRFCYLTRAPEAAVR
jgi:aminoglycoside 6'-N-acetyltransferase